MTVVDPDTTLRIDRRGAPGPGLARVSGTVRGAGLGWPPAVVTLVDHRGRQHGRSDTVDGRYELVLPGPGAWQLIVGAPGHAPRADRLVVAGGARTRVHDVVHDVVLVPAAPGR